MYDAQEVVRGLFRLIKFLVGVFILSVIVFVVLALWKGGEPFRWLGNKTEQASSALKERSEEMAREADRLKRTTDSVRKKTEKVKESLEKTEEKIKRVTGTKSEE